MKSTYEFADGAFGVTQRFPKNLKTSKRAGDLHYKRALDSSPHSSSGFRLEGKSSKIFDSQMSTGREVLMVNGDEKGKQDGNGKIMGHNVSVEGANSVKQFNGNVDASLSKHSELKKDQFKVAFKQLQLQIENIAGDKLKAYAGNFNRRGMADGKLSRTTGRSAWFVATFRLID